MPSISTSTVSPGSIGRELAGVPVRSTSPGLERDQPRQVGELVGDAEQQVARVRLLDDLAVEVRAQREVGGVELGRGDELRAERQEAVLALDAQHRAAVGVAEVVQADVVGARVPGDVVERLGLADALQRVADHDRELALVVEEARARGAADIAAVAVERRRRLHEVRRLRRDPRGVLLDAAAVRQVDGDDLRRRRGREVARLGLGDALAVVEHDLALRRAPHTGSQRVRRGPTRVSAPAMAHNVSIPESSCQGLALE